MVIKLDNMHLIVSINNKLHQWGEGESRKKLHSIILQLEEIRDALPLDEPALESQKTLIVALNSQQPLEIAAPS